MIGNGVQRGCANHLPSQSPLPSCLQGGRWESGGGATTQVVHTGATATAGAAALAPDEEEEKD